MFRPIHLKKIYEEKMKKEIMVTVKKKQITDIFLKLTRTLFCPHNFHEIINEKKNEKQKSNKKNITDIF